MNRPEEFSEMPPNIRVLDFAFLSREQLNALYFESHCLVHPVEGAGWSLPVCEAIAKSVPVIANRHTAISEYILPGEILEPGFQIKPFFFESWSAFPGMPLGFKYYPTLEGLSEALVEMRTNYALYKSRTLEVRERLMRTHTWDITADKLLQTLGEIYA